MKTIILISAYETEVLLHVKDVIIQNLGTLYLEGTPQPCNALLIDRVITDDEKNKLNEVLTDVTQAEFGIFYIHVNDKNIMDNNKFYLSANAYTEEL